MSGAQSIENRLKEYYESAKSPSQKMSALKEYDLARRKLEKTGNELPEELLIEGHQLFLDGLVDYYISNIAPGKIEETAEQRILAWSIGKLLADYDAVLRNRRELKKVREISPDIDKEAKEMHELQVEEALFRPGENEKEKAYLILPKLPNIGQRNIGGGKIVELSWPNPEFFGKKVYATKPYHESPIRDLNKIKKHLRMMGAEIYDKSTDEFGGPVDIVLVPTMNSETKRKYSKSQLVPYEKFARTVENYLPEVIPAGIKGKVRMMWAVRPRETGPDIATENKKFYNLQYAMNKTFLPEIRNLDLPRGVETLVKQNIESLIKDVADFYIPHGSNSVIYKLRHSRL
ncbi:hypothetical protein D6764_01910 [Candidatus Woesearchaeota archaeon]|nr:MAG: hypothetical protein D6764_01910 [Candidatus Woesearchaeota archaeon]